MIKPSCVISCPVDTYSGYGARSRDIVKSLIDIKGDEWDIKILPQRWGDTPHGFLQDNDIDYKDRFIYSVSEVDIWVQITVPNEFRRIGKHLNIGITAGIETDKCPDNWIQGLSSMDLILVSSNHSKEGIIKLHPSLEGKTKVLFEGYNDGIYKKTHKLLYHELKENITNINEDFLFLFVGHWLPGSFGHDRKNVSLLIKLFYETFKNKHKKPGLILKTAMSTPSHMDYHNIKKSIENIKQSVNSNILPNIYLLSGDLLDTDVNELYNHPKVKSMISLTKGEGFGRPLLEFGATGKPIITTNYSGHKDFLNPDYTTLLSGELNEVDKSVQNNFIIPGSKWFDVDQVQACNTMSDIFNNYKKYKNKSIKQQDWIKNKFTLNHMSKVLNDILNDINIDIPTKVKLDFPVLNSELPILK